MAEIENTGTMHVKGKAAMKFPVAIWLTIVFLLPFLLFLSMFVLGIAGLVVYLGYYMPLWDMGEPFFTYSSDIGAYFPSIYGNLVAAVIYSAVYWISYAVFLVGNFVLMKAIDALCDR